MNPTKPLKTFQDFKAWLAETALLKSQGALFEAPALPNTPGSYHYESGAGKTGGRVHRAGGKRAPHRSDTESGDLFGSAATTAASPAAPAASPPSNALPPNPEAVARIRALSPYSQSGKHEVWASSYDGDRSKLHEFDNVEDAHRYKNQQATISAGYGLTPHRPDGDNGPVHMLDKDTVTQMTYHVKSPKGFKEAQAKAAQAAARTQARHEAAGKQADSKHITYPSPSEARAELARLKPEDVGSESGDAQAQSALPKGVTARHMDWASKVPVRSHDAEYKRLMKEEKNLMQAKDFHYDLGPGMQSSKRLQELDEQQREVTAKLDALRHLQRTSASQGASGLPRTAIGGLSKSQAVMASGLGRVAARLSGQRTVKTVEALSPMSSAYKPTAYKPTPAPKNTPTPAFHAHMPKGSTFLGYLKEADGSKTPLYHHAEPEAAAQKSASHISWHLRPQSYSDRINHGTHMVHSYETAPDTHQVQVFKPDNDPLAMSPDHRLEITSNPAQYRVKHTASGPEFHPRNLSKSLAKSFQGDTLASPEFRGTLASQLGDIAKSWGLSGGSQPMTPKLGTPAPKLPPQAPPQAAPKAPAAPKAETTATAPKASPEAAPDHIDKMFGGDAKKAGNFKKWFGASHVVDPNHVAQEHSHLSVVPTQAGEHAPTPVYHGSDHEFNAFDVDKISPHSKAGHGFYFSSDPGVASAFGHAGAYHLSIQHPLDIGYGKAQAQDVRNIAHSMRAHGIKVNTEEHPNGEVSASLEGSQKGPYDYSHIRSGQHSANHLKSFYEHAAGRAEALSGGKEGKPTSEEGKKKFKDLSRSIVERAGYDGWTLPAWKQGKESGHAVWVAMHPHQIKHVDNNGDYSTKNPDLHKAMGIGNDNPIAMPPSRMAAPATAPISGIHRPAPMRAPRPDTVSSDPKATAATKAPSAIKAPQANGLTPKPPKLSAPDRSLKVADSEHIYSSNGVYHPHRAAVHEKIINHFINAADNHENAPKYGGFRPDTPTRPHGVFLAGGSGSGKSFYKNQKYGKHPGFVHIDPDAIKTHLAEAEGRPGYDEENPEFYHEESSALAKELHKRTLQAKKSFIYDGTGSNADSMMKKFDQSRQHGYAIHARRIHVPTDVAMQQNLQRKRTVPEPIFHAIHAGVEEAWPKIAKAADTAKVIDNRRPQAPSPITQQRLEKQRALGLVKSFQNWLHGTFESTFRETFNLAAQRLS